MLKIKALVIFLLFILTCKFSFAQFKEISKTETEDINLNNRTLNKVNVYIFIKGDNNSVNSMRIIRDNLLKSTGNGIFDSTNFAITFIKVYKQGNAIEQNNNQSSTSNLQFTTNINIFKTQNIDICPKVKELVIDSDSLESGFVINPYYIIVDTTGIYSDLKNQRVSLLNQTKISSYKNRSGNKNTTKFVYFPSDSILYELASTKLSNDFVSNNKKNNTVTTGGTPPPVPPTPTYPKSQYGFAIGLGSFLQQYKSANTTIGRSNQSFEKSPLFVNINGFYKTHLSEKVYLKFGLDLLYYSSSIYNKNLYSLPVSSTYITSSNYTINPTNPLAKTNYLIVGLSTSAGYKIKLANKLLLNLEAGFCIGKSIHGWSAANFNVTQGASTTTIKNNSSFSDKISVYFIANPNIEYVLNKNCNIHFGLFSTRGFSKMNSNSNYQFINDNGRYSALENATDKMSSQSLSFTTGISFNIK